MRLGNVNGDLMRAEGVLVKRYQLLCSGVAHPRACSSVAPWKYGKRRTCARSCCPSLVRGLRPLQLESLRDLWHGSPDSCHFGYPSLIIDSLRGAWRKRPSIDLGAMDPDDNSAQLF